MSLVSKQGAMLDKTRPGSWIPIVKLAHRASKSFELSPSAGTDVTTVMEKVVEATKNLDRSGASLHNVNFDTRRVYFHFYTANARWLDVLTIRFCTQEEANAAGKVFGTFVSRSTGMVPASVPLAPVLSAALCFFPFSDWGQNKAHIRDVADKIIEGQLMD